MYPAVNMHPYYLACRVQHLEQEVTHKNAFIRSFQAEIAARDALIHSLRAQLAGRSNISKHTQTVASQKNSATIIVRRTRKNTTDLCTRMKKIRELETEETFREVANLVEGGQNGDGGEIRRVKVSVEYKDGKMHTFWAKNSDRVREIADNEGVREIAENEGELDGDDRMNGEERGVNVEFRDVNDRAGGADVADGNREGNTMQALHSILEAKVKNRISYSALQELRLAGLSGIPTIHKLCQEYRRLATFVDIQPIPVSICFLSSFTC